MKQILIIFSIIMLSANGFSQNLFELQNRNLNTEKPVFTLNAISYPLGLNGEDYRQFRLNYPISQNFGAQLGLVYDKNITSELINSSLMFKWYIKEKLYLFAGLENVYETNPFTNGQYIIQSNVNFGVGYEVDRDFLLELGYHQQINQTDQENFGKQRNKNSFSLRASF